MKGEITDGSKDNIPDLDEHVEAAWEALDDGLTVEIIWEALNLIELYFTLRIFGHILLTMEYMLTEARTHPLEPIEREFVQLKKITGGFFEKENPGYGKYSRWIAFRNRGQYVRTANNEF